MLFFGCLFAADEPLVRSDRLVTSASAQRGSGSVGQAAEMDRRALTQDVLTLRDILAQSQPSEALKLTEGLISV